MGLFGSVLSNLQVYKGKYSLKEILHFDESDAAMVSDCLVCESSQYEGKLALKVNLVDGTTRFIAVSSESELAVGDTPDLLDLVVYQLSRNGDPDIFRVDLA